MGETERLVQEQEGEPRKNSIMRPGEGEILKERVLRKVKHYTECHDIKIERYPLDLGIWKLLLTVAVRF